VYESDLLRVRGQKTRLLLHLNLSKARKDAPETIGDPVPPDIELHQLPPEVATKVPSSSLARPIGVSQT